MGATEAVTLKEEAGRFKAAFDESLRAHLDTITKRYEALIVHPSLATLFAHLRQVAEGGKRLRPFLTHQLYATSNPSARWDDNQELLLAIELFHIFCLIHDDVMDEAPLRHSVLTLHTFAYEALYKNAAHPSGGRKVGESQAILLGDLVFTIVMRLLREHARRGHPHTDALYERFFTLVEEVCLGQMLDIDLTAKASATTEEVTLKNEFKTARYSFVEPLLMGATLAGRADEITAPLTTFGIALGNLYQIQDDLLDILGDPRHTQKETMTDVSQNQHTLLTAFVRKHGGEAATLLQTLSGKTLSDTDKVALRTMFLECGAVDYATKEAETLAKEALATLSHKAFTDTERALLTSVVGLVRGRTT